MAEIRVHELHVADVARWDMRESHPTWHPERRYAATSRFDPFPAYPHGIDVVADAVHHAVSICLPLWDVDLYIADREETSRSNGHSDIIEGYYDTADEWVKNPSGLIMLSGKRIPPHPAMGRYMVAHEYGHHVQYMLNSLRDGVRAISNTTDLEREYAQIRGLPESSVHHGEGGNWHDSCCEIMACDFRILVLNVEREYWPHPGVPRPDQISGTVQLWWQVAMRRLAEARQAAEAA